MASDLCKIDEIDDDDNGGGKKGSPERKTPESKENIVSGRSLRSKHLKIVSDSLYFPKLETTGDIGQGIQTQRESVADTEFGMDSSGIITTLGGDLTPVKKGADLIRASYLNYFDVGLRPIKRKFESSEFELKQRRINENIAFSPEGTIKLIPDIQVEILEFPLISLILHIIFIIRDMKRK